MFGFGKRKLEAKEAARQEDRIKAEADLDASGLLGLNAAYALDQSFLAQSQAQGVLFANMVSEQQRLITAGQAAAIKHTAEMMGVSADRLTPPPAPKA